MSFSTGVTLQTQEHMFTVLLPGAALAEYAKRTIKDPQVKFRGLDLQVMMIDDTFRMSVGLFAYGIMYTMLAHGNARLTGNVDAFSMQQSKHPAVTDRSLIITLHCND